MLRRFCLLFAALGAAASGQTGVAVPAKARSSSW